MMERPPGLLDRVALAVVGGGTETPASKPLREEAPGGSSERLTRRSVLRLAGTGVAALALGLRHAPAAGAQSRDDCISTCYDKYIKAAERDFATCNSFYGGKSVWKGATGWERFRRLVDKGGWTFARDLAREHARRTCMTKAENDFKAGLDRCDDACEETCGPRRSTQSSSALETDSQVCQGTTPPSKSPPPELPPAPEIPPEPPAPDGDADEYCKTTCKSVGGKCCEYAGVFACYPAFLCP